MNWDDVREWRLESDLHGVHTQMDQLYRFAELAQAHRCEETARLIEQVARANSENDNVVHVLLHVASLVRNQATTLIGD